MKEKKIALCLHDVQVSGGNDTIAMIRRVTERINAPITVHLVCDIPLDLSSRLFLFLKEGVDRSVIEIVFHGLSHTCPEGTGKLLSFYHKYQAEYLYDSESLREKTSAAFNNLVTVFGKRSGICPPCWLSSKKNLKLMNSLSPVYIESMFSLNFNGTKVSSPIISLGTKKAGELVFLRKFAFLMYGLSIILNHPRSRLAVHVCDLEVPESMDLFYKIFTGLTSRGLIPVLQRDLVE